ncbi:hypothetical protein Q9189_001427 [Teloschistes chrysophthalmus]
MSSMTIFDFYLRKACVDVYFSYDHMKQKSLRGSRFSEDQFTSSSDESNFGGWGLKQLWPQFERIEKGLSSLHCHVLTGDGAVVPERSSHCTRLASEAAYITAGVAFKEAYGIDTISGSGYPNSALRMRDRTAAEESDPSGSQTPSRRAGSRSQSVQYTPQSHRDLAERSLSNAMSEMALYGPSSRTMTKAEYTAEIKRAKAAFDALKARHNAVEAERNTLSQGHHRYQEQCTTLGTELNRLVAEMRDAKQRYGELRQELKDVQEQLSSAQQELDKARTTIHVQSQTIQGRTNTDATPRRPMPAVPAAPAASTAGPVYAQNYGFGMRPALPSTQTDPRTSLYTRPAPHTLPPRPPTSFGRLPSSHTPLAIRGPGEGENVSWSGDFTLLFKKVENFCHDYLNMPDHESDKYWPTTLGEMIVRESSVPHLRALAGNPSTRYLLLTRILLSLMTPYFFHPRMVKGFDPEIDYKLSEVYAQHNPHNPVHVVFRLAQREAVLMTELSHKPGLEEWRTTYIRGRVNDLMAQLRPVIVPGMQPTFLGNTFASILTDAWRLGLKMLKTTSVFDFDYAAAGNRFEKDCMLNRDPYTIGNPEQLEFNGAVVSLGITPRVVVDEIRPVATREDTTRIVHMANVLLRA